VKQQSRPLSSAASNGKVYGLAKWSMSMTMLVSRTRRIGGGERKKSG
jgi:hypothetical protein